MVNPSVEMHATSSVKGEFADSVSIAVMSAPQTYADFIKDAMDRVPAKACDELNEQLKTKA